MMLKVNHLIGFGRAGNSRAKLIDVLDPTSLVLCVDIGDGASYASDGAQTLTDLSGTADMSAGSAVGVDSLDPVFSGVIGAFTDQEYTVHDGVQDSVAPDVFRFTANPAWVNTVHKAGAEYTIGVLFYLDDASFGKFALGNAVNQSFRGFGITFTSAVTDLGIRSGSGEPLRVSDLPAAPLQKTVLAVISVDETSGTGILMMNGVISTFTSTYISPSALDATRLFSFGSEDYQHGSGASLSENARFYGAFAYQGRHLDAGELLSLHERIEPRFNNSVG